jgi:F-type H+-transporting ATPase subunit b
MAQPQTTAATQGQGDAHDVGFPPFDTQTYAGQLLWLAITFAALYYLISRAVLPRLAAIIEARRATISRDLDEAAALKGRAEEAGLAYEKALADAKANAHELARATRNSLGAETEERRKALEAELASRMAESERIIADSKAAAMSNVNAIAAETASAIVERLTGRAPPPQAVEAALAQTARG